MTVPLWPLQTDALISFDFNSGGLWLSALRQRVNAGQHCNVGYELSRWVIVTTSGEKQRSRGLDRRRFGEWTLYRWMLTCAIDTYGGPKPKDLPTANAKY